ncbi:hypothetical protein [Aneurinibacillus aneurinilyticus]|uniref:hypothetical protein n=1 Tax=Aneurinibacillus aneurinilyticus TaxID=1391 RepID=UPI0023F1C268|nr:hypothetical protein [Aneurinibacillus aneurinilyticus]
MTLVRPGPNRPKDDVVRESKRTKKERDERVNALLDARSSFIALYDTLPDGPMRWLIEDLRDEANRKLREMAE